MIYDAKTLNPMWMKEGVPGTAYARSPKGWIDTKLFKTWLEDHFLKYAVPGRPLLLIVDGHKTHYELPTVEFAKENDVIMLCLPPHSTHASQPLDTCVFNPLKKQWNNVSHDFITKNPGQVISKYNFPRLFREAWEKAMTPNNICAGFRNAGIYPFNPDKLKPTIENEAGDDSEGDSEGDSSTIHNDNTDLYKKRYEEGYDIYDEPYVRWLIVNHPDDVRNDWKKKLKDSEKDSAVTDQIIEKVAGDVVDVHKDSETVESHSGNEDLFQRRYEEGYDIYNENYVRWLMVHHPDDVKSEWLTITATTSKSFERDQSSEKSQVVLSSNNVYGALNRSRKRPQNHATMPGPGKAGKYISKYLHQPIAIPKQTKKQIRLSGARVLTSEQCIKIMKEKENAKKEKELEIQRRNDVRERKKREKATKEKKTTQNTQKGKGKGKGKAAVENINNENWETCPICKQSFDIVKYTMGDWLQCDCEQWLHEDCIFYDFTDPYLCPVCARL